MPRLGTLPVATGGPAAAAEVRCGRPRTPAGPGV